MDLHKFLLIFFNYALFLAFTLPFVALQGGLASRLNPLEPGILMPTEEFEPAAGVDEDDDAQPGTRWAVLVAGSMGYGNYRHQVIIKPDIYAFFIIL